MRCWQVWVWFDLTLVTDEAVLFDEVDVGGA